MFYKDFLIADSGIVHIINKDLDNSDLEIQFGWVDIKVILIPLVLE